MVSKSMFFNSVDEVLKQKTKTETQEMANESHVDFILDHVFVCTFLHVSFYKYKISDF